MQSHGIGKSLLDYIKDKKVRLQLNVYQKNVRAMSFYQREGFTIQSERMDEFTGETEYVMDWESNCEGIGFLGTILYLISVKIIKHCFGFNLFPVFLCPTVIDKSTMSTFTLDK